MLKRLRRMLRHAGIEVVKPATLDKLIYSERKLRRLSSTVQFMQHVSPENIENILGIVDLAKSQIHQDLFVLIVLDFKKNGYFVEFGATNGVDLSNSWLLEVGFGWNGILSEPAKSWHYALSKNRKCNICYECVWTETGKQLIFNEVGKGAFSTLDQYSDEDRHAQSRKHGKKYPVSTISLEHLLTSFNAPRKIDFLSIDTEGSEFEILAAFDFQSWDISIITVEHNFTSRRDQIKCLLEANGYERVLTELSDFDDWYVKSSLAEKVRTRFTNRNFEP